MTLPEVENKIKELENKIKKYDDKEAKGKKLSVGDTRSRNNYKKELQNYQLRKKQMTEKPVETTKVDTSTTSSNSKQTHTLSTKTSTERTLEEKYQEALKKQQALADQLNNANLMNQKLEDEKVMLEQTQKGADQIDDNVEFNVPTWFWREAQEMSPTDKAKRGFIIANHVLNRLGTTTGNIGAIVQNAGGSGGASIKEHGGSLIDQYRQSKLEQAMANRQTKQNARMQLQLDAYKAVGAEENRMREAQRRIRNSGFWGNFERLSNEQQMYIQGLLYSDTEGSITPAMIGNLIKQIMEGKDVSLEQVAVNSLAAGGIDNLDTIVKEAKSLWGGAMNWMFGKKAGE